ncbi:cytidylyltransferase domain-containing protein [Alteromonas sp.]|uniref:acylneuraminate cytidylyltransferase family protein n=1 Tax=Alteromonas sp. TaxID=232 RepID=UPI003518D16A
MLAIIPARGGSKGLPGKNIKDFDGKPLICHTIEAALSSEEISDVVVSTDCPEILRIAQQYPIHDIGLRPSNLATDAAKAVDTYKYVVAKVTDSLHLPVNSFCVLQPTSPLRISSDIDKAVKLFRHKKADSVISMVEESHPIHWHKYLENDLSISPILESNLENRQDLKSSYYPNGAVYIFSHNVLDLDNYYTEKSYGYIMPRNRSVDIDTLDDFEYALFLKRKFKNGK